VDAVALRLHHLRGHVPCATLAHRRLTGVDALDECPRHQRQCQGKAEPALTLNSLEDHGRPSRFAVIRSEDPT
jgi:hypothetical protein